MKLKINKQNYLLYLVIFTIILLLFFYLLSDKEAIIRQLYKEFNGTSPPGGVLREGISADGLDWAIYSGYYDNPILGDLTGPIYSGSGAYDMSSLKTITQKLDIDNTTFHRTTIILKGFFVPTVNGNWNFRISSDDASYLWLKDAAKSGWNRSNSLVDNGGLHGVQTRVSKYPIQLTAGEYYDIRIQMGENQGLYTLKFEWQAPGTNNWSSYGAGMLFSSKVSDASNPQRGLIWRSYKGYLENVGDLSNYQLTGSGRAVDMRSLSTMTKGKIVENTCITDRVTDTFPTGYYSCGNGSNDHQFTLDIKGYFYTNSAADKNTEEDWSFFLTSDDFSYFWIGDSAASNRYDTRNADINNGGLHGMNNLPLTNTVKTKRLKSKTYYPMRILFGENSGGYNLRFGWKPPGGNWTCDGSLYLYSDNYDERSNANSYYTSTG